ncbi:MAG TPA: beta-galactosidase, partial [Mucilaginibacter sp.]
GGSVVLVQLENEHPKAWGTAMPDGYFKYLQTKALQMGMQVPYFFSGLHHASDPAGNGQLDDANRPNPWFSTEFWSVWYSQYGAKPGDAELYDRRTWKIIAHGGNGYNYYMVHGGSNFDYTNNDEDAASYDYGAAIGQAGDLRPIYYTFKRAAWFARSFQDVLENSADASAQFNGLVADTGLRLSARKSPAGDILFIDNPGLKALSTNFHVNGADALLSGKKITVQPKEIYPVIHNYKLNDDVTLNWAFTRIFAIVKQQNTTTLITDSEPGAPLLLQFGATGQISSVSADVKVEQGRVTIDKAMPEAAKPLEYTFKTGTQTIRVLAMTRQQTDKTFITNAAGKTYIISGFNYVADVGIKNQQFTAVTERPLKQVNEQAGILYTGGGSFSVNSAGSAAIQQPVAIPLTNWMYKDASGPARQNANMANWLKSKDPQPMGADGDITADAWYKTILNIPSGGKYTLQVNGGGRGQAFIDGKPAKKWSLNDNEVTLNLEKGRHTMVVFAAHDGRDKLVSYLGPIDKVDSKGLFGKALIKKGGPFIMELKDWYFTKASKKADVQQGAPAFDTLLYKKYKIGADVFNLKEGYGWFKTIIPAQPAGTTKMTIRFKSVDENATVFINGKLITRHDGWNQSFEVNITDAEVLKKPIDLSLFIENYSNEGGIDQPVKINAIGDADAVTGWQLKGGPGNALAVSGWKKMMTTAPVTNGPCFYRSSFTVPQVKGKTFIWRFEPEGLGHGSVWVNGHNIGRYPEKIQISSLYIPECWLHAGSNQLVIYDEDGKAPNKAGIIAEASAGRTLNTFTQPLTIKP